MLLNRDDLDVDGRSLPVNTLYETQIGYASRSAAAKLVNRQTDLWTDSNRSAVENIDFIIRPALPKHACLMN